MMTNFEKMQDLALACSYMGIDKFLKNIREDIEKYNFPPTYRVDWSSYDSDSIKLIYGWLVCMFGNYGVNPQNGWIEKTYDCCSFLESFEEMIRGEENN